MEELKKKYLFPGNWLTSSSKFLNSSYRKILLICLVGLVLIGLGVLFLKAGNLSGTKVEILNSTKEGEGAFSEIVVEVSGQVEKPGVYKLPFGSRVEDALILSGGLSSSADRVWVEKSLNRAAKLIDGQKLYIPQKGTSNLSNTGNTSNLININTADAKTLDTLPGIGQVYGQSIIEHRPYSNIEELLSKGVLKTGVYEKIKDKITVY